jgi:hypothetical protein
VINCENISDWFNRVYLYFLIGQVRNFFINNPKLFLIFFKEEYPHICKDAVLDMTNKLINTPNITAEQLINLSEIL